jgi:ubiquinone/menaquinone biosynthesis C-methylase UbiE
MKLNLGSGFKKKEGYTNVDVFAEAQPDVCHDLLITPWPWSDNSADEVVFEFSLEQMGETTAQLITILKESYRVLKTEGLLKVVFHHPRHDQFYLNPFNRHRLSFEFFQLCSMKYNLDVIPTGVHDNLVAIQHKINFETVSYKPHFDAAVVEQYNAKKVSADDLQFMSRFQNNVIHVCELEMKKK